jgi:hypothetical protein
VRTNAENRVSPAHQAWQRAGSCAHATYPGHDSLCHHHLNREMRGIAAGNIALSFLYNCHLLLQTLAGVKTELRDSGYIKYWHEETRRILSGPSVSTNSPTLHFSPTAWIASIRPTASLLHRPCPHPCSRTVAESAIWSRSDSSRSRAK